MLTIDGFSEGVACNAAYTASAVSPPCRSSDSAIPAVMAYNYFVRRIRVVSADMETFANDFLNIIRRRFF